jgi:hypothetical protein
VNNPRLFSRWLRFPDTGDVVNSTVTPLQNQKTRHMQAVTKLLK